MSELKQELMGLRNGAMRVNVATPEHEQADEISVSLSSGPWRFEDGNGHHDRLRSVAAGHAEEDPLYGGRRP